MRLGHAQLRGDVGERAVAVVAVEPVRAVHVRDVQVEVAVVVVVAPGGALGPALVAAPRPSRRRSRTYRRRGCGRAGRG